jgi:hypothetical protein
MASSHGGIPNHRHDPYDACMLSRHSWIAAFIGHVLRGARATDPDRVFDTASELYPELGELNPEFVADSAFGPPERATEPSGTAHMRAALACLAQASR